jgi:hypothetical protein
MRCAGSVGKVVVVLGRGLLANANLVEQSGELVGAVIVPHEAESLVNHSQAVMLVARLGWQALQALLLGIKALPELTFVLSLCFTRAPKHGWQSFDQLSHSLSYGGKCKSSALERWQ